MQKAKKIYYKIIFDLETQYSQKNFNEFAKAIYQKFKEQVITQFKMHIVFDQRVKHAMINRIQDQFKSNYYSQSFKRTLQYIGKLSQYLLKEKFISKRHNQQISSLVKKHKQHPINSKLTHLKYLNAAKDQDQFRQEFFIRFYQQENVDEDEWTDDQFCKPRYQHFWRQILAQKPPKNIVVFFDSCFFHFEDKIEMLSQQLRKQIQQYIGDQVGRSQQELQCNRILKQIAIKNSFQVNTQTKNKINRQYEMIVGILNKFSGQSKFLDKKIQIKVNKFGSLVSGFCGKDADLDITLLTNCYVNEKSLLEYLRDYLQIQFKERDKMTGKKTKIQFINASNPLVQVIIQQARRGQSFKIDILINNILGVVNSKFLSVYSQIPWIKYLAILIKYWGKGITHKVIDKHLLSSYAIVLMLLHFLIKKKKINLIYDARNRSATLPNFMYKRRKLEEVQEFQVYYMFKKNKGDVTKLENVNLLQTLKQFFKYYSNRGEHWTTNQGKNIITVDGATRDFEEDCAFTIRDPFDKFHNPGRAKQLHKNQFQRTFLEAYQQLEAISIKQYGERLRNELQKFILDS